MRKSDPDLERSLHWLERKLPNLAAPMIRFVRANHSVWVRVPAGVGLVLGGVFSFLPVLGVWMLPLGLLVLARDVPVMQRPAARMLAWIERRWP